MIQAPLTTARYGSGSTEMERAKRPLLLLAVIAAVLALVPTPAFGRSGSGRYAVQAVATLSSPTAGACTSTATVTWEALSVDEVQFNFYVNSASVSTYQTIISPAESSGSAIVSSPYTPSVPQGETFYFVALLATSTGGPFATSRTVTC
jgi:hypothetical protein